MCSDGPEDKRRSESLGSLSGGRAGSARPGEEEATVAERRQRGRGPEGPLTSSSERKNAEQTEEEMDLNMSGGLVRFFVFSRAKKKNRRRAARFLKPLRH